jgi:hypothetical protein
MMILRIKDWDKHFENNRTRELKKLSWVPFPNKQDGDGYTELMEYKNGVTYFGCWCAICEVASKCDPRGTLMRDGKRPHDYGSLSRMTRISKEILEEAIKILINIGWLEVYDNPAGKCDADILSSADGCASRARVPEGKEGKERREEEAPPPAPVKNRFSEAIQKLRNGHIAFKTVPDVSLENTFKAWPEDRWQEAIGSLSRRYAGANIPRPIPTLENHLAGKSGGQAKAQSADRKPSGKESWDKAIREV